MYDLLKGLDIFVNQKSKMEKIFKNDYSPLKPFESKLG
jgi:hypothetical protein